MSNEVVYKIVLTNDTQGNNVADKAGGAGGIKKATQQSDEPKGQTNKKTSAKKAFKKIFLYTGAKSVGSNIVSGRVLTVQLRTGSSDAQQKAEFWYNAGQKAWSFGESVITGALVGGGIGAAIGAVFSVINSGIDMVQTYERLNLQKQLEDTTQTMNMQRETVSGSRYQGATQI